jgi:hypothetical protein
MASVVGRPVVLIVEDESLLRISGAEMVAEQDSTWSRPATPTKQSPFSKAVPTSISSSREGDLPKGGSFVGKPQGLRRSSGTWPGSLATANQRSAAAWRVPVRQGGPRSIARTSFDFPSIRYGPDAKIFQPTLETKPVLLIHLAPPWRWLPGCLLGLRNRDGHRSCPVPHTHLALWRIWLCAL